MAQGTQGKSSGDSGALESLNCRITLAGIDIDLGTAPNNQASKLEAIERELNDLGQAGKVLPSRIGYLVHSAGECTELIGAKTAKYPKLTDWLKARVPWIDPRYANQLKNYWADRENVRPLFIERGVAAAQVASSISKAYKGKAYAEERALHIAEITKLSSAAAMQEYWRLHKPSAGGTEGGSDVLTWRNEVLPGADQESMLDVLASCVTSLPVNMDNVTQIVARLEQIKVCRASIDKAMTAEGKVRYSKALSDNASSIAKAAATAAALELYAVVGVKAAEVIHKMVDQARAQAQARAK